MTSHNISNYILPSWAKFPEFDCSLLQSNSGNLVFWKTTGASINKQAIFIKITLAVI